MPFVIVAIVALIDQLLKYWAVVWLKPLGSVPLIEGVLYLTYAQNTGASFSILEGNVLLLIEITVVAVIGIFMAIYDPRWCGGRHALWKQITLSILAGGAIGNLIDRMLLGYVIDYVDLQAIRWAISNFADHCVVICGIMFCVILLFFDEDSPLKKKEKKQETRSAVTSHKEQAAEGEGGHV